MDCYYGHLATVSDALRLLEAANIGVIRVFNHRLSSKERDVIRSGAIFIFDASKNGIQRWTDGFRWSASRLHGHFLTYTQKEIYGQGLIKRSLSVVTADNKRFGLVNYYFQSDLDTLLTPTSDKSLANLQITQNYYFRRISQFSSSLERSYILTPLTGESEEPFYTSSPQKIILSPIQPYSKRGLYTRPCSPLPSIKNILYMSHSSPTTPSISDPNSPLERKSSINNFYALSSMKISCNYQKHNQTEDQRQLNSISHPF